MLSARSFSLSSFLWKSPIALFPRPTSLFSRVISWRSVLIVSLRCGASSRAVRARLASPADCRPAPPLRAGDAARASCSRATSLLSAPTNAASLDRVPASERSASRRTTCARKEGTSRAALRSSFASSSASLSLRRQDLNRDFHEPASLRAATSVQAQFFATRFGRLRPRPLLFIQGLEIARRDRRCRPGRRPEPVAALGQPRVYGEIFVQNRHALDDSASQIVLPAPLCSLDSRWTMLQKRDLHGLAERLQSGAKRNRSFSP